MPTVKNAVIAAAGLGSRLGHGKPKCLVEIDGVSILSHLLSLLTDVEDVRVVIGFEERAVISEIKRIRPDVIAVRNPDFRSTTTLHSYAAGARYLKGDCLFMDGDILFEPDSFRRFVATCKPDSPRLAITKTKTKDAVFLDLEGEMVTRLRRGEPSEYEWANVAWLPVRFFQQLENTPVFEHLGQYMPIEAGILTSYEIDTETDLLQAQQNRHLFCLDAAGTAGALAP